ncbi:MAG: biotin--[acetyl-CoA-carboxylase] ligase [Arachidicoccus sp.]|nr:biotin--[acetyl-CoA-carboxylase] ligase [Arachidicoccus sp.]
MTGKTFTILNETDSSNNYASNLILSGNAIHGDAVFAKHQTKGKGQRGKLWNDESGKNIALSVMLEMAGIQSDKQFGLIATVALSVFDIIKKYTSDEAKIKWPNDIYWRDRKAVGILIENKFSGQFWQWAIAGMGVNVNQTQFDDALKAKAVSLKQITGKEFDCIELAKEMHGRLLERFDQLKNSNSEEILKEYNYNLYKKEEEVQIIYKNEKYKTVVRQADESGNLWMDNAPQPYFTFGEIEWVL